MTHISEYTTRELCDDLGTTIVDIRLCERALAKGITKYKFGKLSERLENNKKVRGTIEAELEARGVT